MHSHGVVLALRDDKHLAAVWLDAGEAEHGLRFDAFWLGLLMVLDERTDGAHF